MSDTPDVLDAIDMVLEAWIDIENVERVRDGLLRVFTEQQLVVVKADGLSHGDELVPCYVDADGDVYAATPHGPDYGASYGRLFVRRPVPENGDTQ